MDIWIRITSILLSVSSLLRQMNAEQRKQKEEVQKAVSNAFHSTDAYYTYRDSGKPRDTDREFSIARDWEHASILIEPLDADLANRLGIKSCFWREGGLWSDQQIKEAGIQLKKVRAEGMTIES